MAIFAQAFPPRRSPVPASAPDSGRKRRHLCRETAETHKSLTNVTNACKEADVSVQKELLIETSDYLSETKVALSRLIKATEEAAAISDAEEQAHAYHRNVVPAMEALRTPVDKLEMIVDKAMWPMPSYGDLLFEV